MSLMFLLIIFLDCCVENSLIATKSVTLGFNESKKLTTLSDKHLYDLLIEAEISGCVNIRLPFEGKSIVSFDSHSGKSYRDRLREVDFFPKYYDFQARKIQKFDSIYACNTDDSTRCKEGVLVTYSISSHGSNSKVTWHSMKVFLEANYVIEIILLVVLCATLSGSICLCGAGVLYGLNQQNEVRKRRMRKKEEIRKRIKKAQSTSRGRNYGSFTERENVARHARRTRSHSPGGVRSRVVNGGSISKPTISESTSAAPTQSSACVAPPKRRCRVGRQISMDPPETASSKLLNVSLYSSLSDLYSEKCEAEVSLIDHYLKCHLTEADFVVAESPDSILYIDLSCSAALKRTNCNECLEIRLEKNVEFHGDEIGAVKLFMLSEAELDEWELKIRIAMEWGKGKEEDGFSVEGSSSREKPKPMLKYCVRSFHHFVDSKNGLKAPVFVSLPSTTGEEVGEREANDNDPVISFVKLNGRSLELYFVDKQHLAVYLHNSTEFTLFSDPKKRDSEKKKLYPLQLRFVEKSKVFGNFLEIHFLDKPTLSKWVFVFEKMLGIKFNRPGDPEAAEMEKKFTRRLIEARKLFNLSSAKIMQMRKEMKTLELRRYWRIHERMQKIAGVLLGVDLDSHSMEELRMKIEEWICIDESEQFFAFPVKIMVIDQDQKRNKAVKLFKKEVLGRIVQFVFRDLNSIDHLSLCIKNLRIDWGNEERFKIRDIDPENVDIPVVYQPHMMFDVDCVCLRGSEFLNWCLMLAVSLVELEERMTYQLHPNGSLQIAKSLTLNEGMSCQDACIFVMREMCINPKLYPGKVRQFLRGTMKKTTRAKEMKMKVSISQQHSSDRRKNDPEKEKVATFETHKDIEEYIEFLKTNSGKWFYWTFYEDLQLLKSFDRVLHLEKRDQLSGTDTCFFNVVEDWLYGLFRK